jgi:hypothetical protein
MLRIILRIFPDFQENFLIFPGKGVYFYDYRILMEPLPR